MRRFRGTFLGLLALAAASGAWLAAGPAPEAESDGPPAIFRFEKEDVVGFRIERPDRTIEMVEQGGEWIVPGADWRPARSMVRRVAHQLHDLTARAVVTEAPDDPALYGLGEGAVRVRISLKGGRELRFDAGDPNPTGVSYYVRPIPGEAVYVVKKSAMDFYSFDLDEFRERRFAALDADRADRIAATVGGRALALHRTGDDAWTMTAPVLQEVEREEVRTMLGRTGALKASRFVADHPEDLARFGLAAPHATVRIDTTDGEIIDLRVGDELPGTDPLERYVYRVDDDAVYAARAGFLEAFEKDVAGYRKRTVLGLHEWELAALVVTRGDLSLRVTRSSDDWHWGDGAPIPGSTPRRVASHATELTALAFHDDEVPEAGMGAPFATISLEPASGAPRTVTVGGEILRGEETRRFVRVDGDATTYEVEGTLGSVIEDLFREHGRKAERDAEKLARPGGGE